MDSASVLYSKEKNTTLLSKDDNTYVYLKEIKTNFV